MEPVKQPSREPGGIIAGRYRLKERLAAGGVGEVWVAEHCHLKQEVAIKFIKEEHFADRAAALSVLERFRFESQVSAMLGRRTRHVVCVHDAGDSEAGPFLAMEYVPGSSLSDDFKVYGPIRPERLADILDQVADALGAAHGVGIVHRDIKPANILVVDQPDGSPFVKVADFGIAKALNPELPLDRPKSTAAMTLVGTLDYMSPEQVTGGEVQPAMDIWALGVTCYKLLTGVLPFKASSRMERIHKIVFEPMASPSSHRPDLPAALDAWFSRALAKNPADRFATVREMTVAYRAVIDVQANAPTEHAAAYISTTQLEGSRRTPLGMVRLDRTTFTSATAHLDSPTEPTRSGVRWGAIIAATAIAAVLAAALLFVQAPKASAPESSLAVEAPPAVAQSTILQPSAPRPTAEPAPSVAPQVASERTPIIERPVDPPSRHPRPSKFTNSPPAEPPRESPPAPSAIAPTPAAPIAPKRPPQDPSSVL